MLAAALLAVAAALPLGVWPGDIGAAATTVRGIDFYLVEPEDDYSIIAVQPLETPLRKAEPAALDRLATLADKLGADAVLLLGEMPEKSIPSDPDAPLPTSGRYAVAVFLAFDQVEGWDAKPAVPSVLRRTGRAPRAVTRGAAARVSAAPPRM
ncbi:MAG: hypothetical protein PHQ91_02130 [Thermoanaerobaculaceae bacterium]|nr:hypothetical protein [Thermoanaerobaculaceae bacterium]TAM46357.1 MAG: hypothetical protein EPN53_13375 [Acidobacteriota bacterium]